MALVRLGAAQIGESPVRYLFWLEQERQDYLSPSGSACKQHHDPEAFEDFLPGLRLLNDCDHISGLQLLW